MSQYLFRCFVCAATILACVPSVSAQQSIKMKRDLLDDLDLGSSADLSKFGLDPDKGAFPDDDAPYRFLEATIGRQRKVDLDSDNFYCIIHVLKWAPSVEVSGGQIAAAFDVVSAQHWYLYRGGNDWELADFTGKRIWGERDNVYLLYVHLDHRFGEYTPDYRVEVKEKRAANEQALIDVLQVLGAVVPGVSPAAAPGGVSTIDWPNPSSYWGYGKIDPKTRWTAADYTVAAYIERKDTKPKNLDADQVFDNEGRYQWDVAVGVPIQRATELKNEDGMLTPKQVDKSKLFAMLKFYPIPVDVKQTGLIKVPGVFVGLDVANKHPADRLAVGGTWGLAFANMFVGRQRTKFEDDTVKWEWIFGVSMGARQIKALLTPDK
jgi:hypothetical protein